jgi:bifunctional DNA-binding transcriptional regulator/antitoxin component of YhaV-PrlF toxin-antitoxin module
MTVRADGEARLRPKNQLTLPEPIADYLEAEPDDVLVFETDPAQPGAAIIRRLPRGFAGSMRGVYGTSQEVKAFIREEHEAWGE